MIWIRVKIAVVKICVLGAMSYITVSTAAAATHTDDAFRMRVYVGNSGAHCSEGPSLQTGAMHTVTFVVISPRGKTERDFEWWGPEGMTLPSYVRIEAGTYDESSGSFVTNPDVLTDLRLAYWVPRAEQNVDEKWIQRKMHPFGYQLPRYHFYVQPSPPLAGRTICFRIIIDHPHFGHIELSQPECFTVHAPCDELARQEGLASVVIGENHLDHFEASLAAADSLISVTTPSITVLRAAIGSAKELQRYDDAIRYLDLLWSAYGTLESLYDLRGSPEVEQQRYESWRNSIIELRDQQQQR